jgi:hypothetical protein
MIGQQIAFRAPADFASRAMPPFAFGWLNGCLVNASIVHSSKRVRHASRSCKAGSRATGIIALGDIATTADGGTSSTLAAVSTPSTPER